ncbi:hypothetical protein UCDDS831_g00473 [Diplodia seriata]|uniref:Uncharacterized protein n=1 Tax=Diplodia seriata TaxID=420778 RepID=A0A0G2GY69_9PEZI|nr:hypothetical protein UCDDS831_g00473 [Diplodia seriata]
MDDWGDPWQDDAAPKHPPTIDVHILADRQTKERVVTPVLTGFFEDQHKWSEPDSHDIAEEPESEAENEHQATTPAPNEEMTEDTPSVVPEETDDDTNEITTENEPEDRVQNDPEDTSEDRVEETPEDEVEDTHADTPEDRVEETHEDTPEDTFDDDDFDDFGDFEEEADEVLEDETANNIESPPKAFR